MNQQSRAAVLPDMSGLPGLRAYLDSLDTSERTAASARLASMPPADLRSLGASEAQRIEHGDYTAPVEGELPEGLTGTLYRNGPGRWEDHTGRPLHHLFDGDGMISAFRIQSGEVRYRNRYVRTPHFRGRGTTRHLGTDAAGGWLANIGSFPPNLANTNVVEHAGHLYALWEGGPPHEVDPETLETLGIRRFSGELHWAGTYSAHPCLCPSSGEMFNFGVEFVPTPHLRVYRTDRHGKLRHYRSASLPYVAMVHDFAITERHLVFLVSPIIPDGIPIALGLKSFGDGMTYRPERGSSFVLIPRDGGKIRRIEHEAVLQFHLSNAYDDRGDIVVDAITYDNGDLLDCIARFRTSPMDRVSSEFTRFRITAGEGSSGSGSAIRPASSRVITPIGRAGRIATPTSTPSRTSGHSSTGLPNSTCPTTPRPPIPLQRWGTASVNRCSHPGRARSRRTTDGCCRSSTRPIGTPRAW